MESRLNRGNLYTLAGLSYNCARRTDHVLPEVDPEAHEWTDLLSYGGGDQMRSAQPDY
jgi:hypothetical protein